MSDAGIHVSTVCNARSQALHSEVRKYTQVVYQQSLPVDSSTQKDLKVVTNAYGMTSPARVGHESCVTERGTMARRFRPKMPSHKTTPPRNAELSLSLLLQHYAPHHKTL